MVPNAHGEHDMVSPSSHDSDWHHEYRQKMRLKDSGMKKALPAPKLQVKFPDTGHSPVRENVSVQESGALPWTQPSGTNREGGYWIHPDGRQIQLPDGEEDREHHFAWLYRNREHPEVKPHMALSPRDREQAEEYSRFSEKPPAVDEDHAAQFMKNSGWVRHSVWPEGLGVQYQLPNTKPETFERVRQHFIRAHPGRQYLANTGGVALFVPNKDGDHDVVYPDDLESNWHRQYKDQVRMYKSIHPAEVEVFEASMRVRQRKALREIRKSGLFHGGKFVPPANFLKPDGEIVPVQTHPLKTVEHRAWLSTTPEGQEVSQAHRVTPGDVDAFQRASGWVKHRAWNMGDHTMHSYVIPHNQPGLFDVVQRHFQHVGDPRVLPVIHVLGPDGNSDSFEPRSPSGSWHGEFNRGGVRKSFGNSLNQTPNPAPPEQSAQSVGPKYLETAEYLKKPEGHEDHIDALNRIHRQFNELRQSDGINAPRLHKEVLHGIGQLGINVHMWPDIAKRDPYWLNDLIGRQKNSMVNSYKLASSYALTPHDENSDLDVINGVSQDDSPIDRLKKRSDGEYDFNHNLKSLVTNKGLIAKEALNNLGEAKAFQFMQEMGFSAHEAARHLLEAQRRLEAEKMQKSFGSSQPGRIDIRPGSPLSVVVRHFQKPDYPEEHLETINRVLNQMKTASESIPREVKLPRPRCHLAIIQTAKDHLDHIPLGSNFKYYDGTDVDEATNSLKSDRADQEWAINELAGRNRHSNPDFNFRIANLHPDSSMARVVRGNLYSVLKNALQTGGEEHALKIMDAAGNYSGHEKLEHLLEAQRRLKAEQEAKENSVQKSIESRKAARALRRAA